MKYCPNCGHENPDDAEKCSSCRARLRGVAPTKKRKRPAEAPPPAAKPGLLKPMLIMVVVVLLLGGAIGVGYWVLRVTPLTVAEAYMRADAAVDFPTMKSLATAASQETLDNRAAQWDEVATAEDQARIREEAAQLEIRAALASGGVSDAIADVQITRQLGGLPWTQTEKLFLVRQGLSWKVDLKALGAGE